MDITMFAVFFGLAALLLTLSVIRKLRIMGAFSGFIFILVWISIATTGIDIPFGQTEIIDTDKNVTRIHLNTTDIFPRDSQINLGMSIVLLGLSVYIIFVNILNIIEERRTT